MEALSNMINHFGSWRPAFANKKSSRASKYFINVKESTQPVVLAAQTSPNVVIAVIREVELEKQLFSIIVSFPLVD